MSMFSAKPVTTKSTTSLPSWLTDLAKGTAEKASDIASQGYTAYTGANPYGGTSEDSRSAFQGLRDWITGGGGGSTDAITGYMSAPAQSVSTEGIFDGEGIDKHMNKYTDAALTPALRKISEAADAARNRAKSSATASGSFGDARHGIVENGINRNEATAIGDTSAQYMSQAFRDAVASRQSDLARALSAGTTNAQLAEGALGRQMTGAQALDNQQKDWLQRLLSAGQYQDTQNTAAKTFDYNTFLEGRDWDKNSTSWLMSLLQGTPTDKTTSNTQEGGTSPWLSILGSALGTAATKI
jgi:hypothetical protein